MDEALMTSSEDARALRAAAKLLALGEKQHAASGGGQHNPDGWMRFSELSQSSLFSAEGARFDFWLTKLNALAAEFPYQALHHEASAYPARLHGTKDAPAVLFVRGELADDALGAIAMVGSRKASDAAMRAARELAEGFSKVGIDVVSGMARGVDTAAHTGALAAGGGTTAVLGTGLDHVFPPENGGLMGDIASAGAVVSQFPPGARPSKTSFPARNAVVAGLSHASLIIEAEERSGTRIELNYALKYGRKIFFWEPLMKHQRWAQEMAATNDLVSMAGSLEDILRDETFQGF